MKQFKEIKENKHFKFSDNGKGLFFYFENSERECCTEIAKAPVKYKIYENGMLKFDNLFSELCYDVSFKRNDRTSIRLGIFVKDFIEKTEFINYEYGIAVIEPNAKSGTYKFYLFTNNNGMPNMETNDRSIFLRGLDIIEQREIAKKDEMSY
ncbi:MAG: hypothetical protein WCX32_00995 [Clostridia bacterium]|jgi:hypothetical protein|nr:hypothetical protein [Clostridia bacterium]